VGVVRCREELEHAVEELRTLYSELRLSQAGPAEFELLNLLTLGTQIARTALLREETRGVHMRSDFPEPDERWKTHSTVRLPEIGEGGEMREDG
jgi:L-aspartate oxidase